MGLFPIHPTVKEKDMDIVKDITKAVVVATATTVGVLTGLVVFSQAAQAIGKLMNK